MKARDNHPNTDNDAQCLMRENRRQKISVNFSDARILVKEAKTGLDGILSIIVHRNEDKIR